MCLYPQVMRENRQAFFDHLSALGFI